MSGKLSNAMPDLKEAWLIFFLLLAGQLAVSVLEAAVFGASGIAAGSERYIEIQSALMPLVYAAGYILPVAYILWLGKKRVNENAPGIDRPRFGRLGVWGFLSLAVLTEAALVVLLDSMPQIGKVPEWMEDALENMMETGLLYTIVTVSVLAPVMEEFVFRGVILRGLLRRMRPVWAIFWSSALFALAHMNPWQAVPAFVIGCLFGWLYFRSGSYWTVVLLHALNNAATVAASSVFGMEVGGDQSLVSLAGPYFGYLLAGTAAVVLVVGIILIDKYLQKDKNSLVL